MKLESKIMGVLQEIENTRGVTREQIVGALKEAMLTAYEKAHGHTRNLVVEITFGAVGEVEAYLEKEVVASVGDPKTQIALTEARELDETADLGDSILCEVALDDLGFLAVHYAKQRIVNLIREAEKDLIMHEFKMKLFHLFNATMLYQDRGEIYVEVGKAEGIIPFKEQIASEKLKPNSRIKVVLVDVRSSKKDNMLIFSRTHPDLVRRLMENEIPEVREGSIEIVAIAREPGHRAKVAVRSKLPELDAVGACIGSKGIRILAISNELGDEKIDLIPFHDDPFEYIAEALSPAKVSSVEIFEDDRRAIVIVPDDQISLAIGRAWRNVRLASKLTKYKLEVKSLSESAHEAERRER